MRTSIDICRSSFHKNLRSSLFRASVPPNSMSRSSSLHSTCSCEGEIDTASEWSDAIVGIVMTVGSEGWPQRFGAPYILRYADPFHID
jgi:hypothetical protein